MSALDKNKTKINTAEIKKVVNLIQNTVKKNKISEEEVSTFLARYFTSNLNTEIKVIEALEKSGVQVITAVEEAKKVTEQDIKKSNIDLSEANYLLLQKKKQYDFRGKLSWTTNNNRILVADSSKFLLRSIGQHSVLDEKSERELITMLNSNNKILRRMAVDKLVKCNLRLIFAIANKYQNRGIDVTDLFNEGILGVYRAIDKFDSNKFGNRFSTYTTWWIRQAMTRAISEQTRLVRLPVHMIDSINLIYRKEREWIQKYEKLPTSTALAKNINKDKQSQFHNKMLTAMNYKLEEDEVVPEEIASLLIEKLTPNRSHSVIMVDPKKESMLKKYNLVYANPTKYKILTKKDIENLRKYSLDIISLEKPISDAEGSVFADFISDSKIGTPEKENNYSVLKKQLHKLLNQSLSNKERAVLCMRRGLTPFTRVYSLDEIGEHYDLSRERIRQIYNKSINKLSHPTLQKQIKDFFYEK